jgi:hypothetical protein
VLAVLALALPVTLGNAPALAAGAVGASITCTNGDAILGPLHSSVTVAPGTSGTLVLGGIDGGKGKYIGNCVLNGTVPAGWKVTEASWVDLSATSGSGNAGKLELETPNSTFVDTGTFTNSGTFEDASSGLTQMLLVGDFVNTGSVVAAGGAFGTAGMANNPTCPKCTFVDEGTVEVNPEQSFSSGSIFVLAPGGTIDDRGTFGIANESSFDIEGGSVTDGEPTSTQYLGLGAPTIKFGTGLPPTSHGSIDITDSADLQGVIARHWALNVTGGSVAATDAGNAGTFLWDHDDNATFSDATTFVNSGTFTDNTTGWSQYIEVSRFVNTGTVLSEAPGFGMSGATGITGPVFVNYGRLVVEPKASFGVAGTFELAGGAVINRGGFGIDKSTLEVSGGSLLGNPATDVYYLGAGPATVTFAPSVPDSSAGTIDFSIGLTLNGIVPKKWVIDNIGGIGPALTANDSGNDGTIIWGASGPFTTNGTFVNTGSLDDTGGSLNLTAQDFVNAPNGKVMVSSDGGFSSSGNFRNDGDLDLGPGNKLSVAGNYSQAPGGALGLGAGGSFSVGSVSVGGTAGLGGALAVDRMAGLKVTTGDTASVVTAHAVAGRFKPVSGLVGPGPALVISYGPAAVTLGPGKTSN